MPHFRVSRWAAWSPGLPTQEQWQAWCERPDLAALCGDAQPPLQELPPMTRRRIDPVGRAALQAAFQAQGPHSTGPVVFTSRWGEIARSVSLLRELTQGQPLSPTAFSLSVHNAQGAVYSIARGDTENYTALSAGPCSAAAGVCEALGLLAEGAQQVLVVSVEAPLPDPYQAFEAAPLPLRAWAALIEAGGPLRLEATSLHENGHDHNHDQDQDQTQLPAQLQPPEPPLARPDAALPPDLAALRMLTGALPSLRQAGWHWTRHD
ncbi:beta-ketoacyl synthase chain length factor [Roseateles terrae]|uniref:Beta-ketoacyl synthase-like N-terminal domain-containing protein n=1 Tax=Roseateles terrae TaxID=431060 RepID=A0ABR6GQ54_9BURK|nr:beta-ketoacyl synthase chain length factor [Roseateles terrae]MBB3194231.1 hypothetical protein [Roseateles terrae]